VEVVPLSDLQSLCPQTVSDSQLST